MQYVVNIKRAIDITRFFGIYKNKHYNDVSLISSTDLSIFLVPFFFDFPFFFDILISTSSLANDSQRFLGLDPKSIRSARYFVNFVRFKFLRDARRYESLTSTRGFNIV